MSKANTAFCWHSGPACAVDRDRWCVACLRTILPLHICVGAEIVTTREMMSVKLRNTKDYFENVLNGCQHTGLNISRGFNWRYKTRKNIGITAGSLETLQHADP